MLDELILQLHDEISLDGRRGTSLSRLWKISQRLLNQHAESLMAVAGDVLPPGFTPRLDDSIKARIWDMLRAHPDIFLHYCEQPLRSGRNTPVRQERDDDDDGDEYNGQDDEDKIDTVATLPELKPLHEAKTWPLDELMARAGHNAIITTSSISQMRALISKPHATEIGYGISDVCYNFLEAIGRRRDSGLTQMELKDIFNVDSKSVFHFVKALIKAGYIGKRPVLVKGSMTQLACLSRYMGNIADSVETEETYNIENPFQDNDAAKGGRIDSELIKIRMSRSLEAAKDQTLTVEDLKPLVGLVNASLMLMRWFNRNLMSMEEKGYIQRFLVPSMNKRVGYTRCIQLLKPYTGRDAADEPEDDNRALKQEPMFESKSEIEFLADVPLEYQVYEFVKEAGIDGVSTRQIYTALPHCHYKYLYKILEMACSYGIKGDEDLRLYRIGCIDGRMRYFLYYTKEAFELAPDLRNDADQPKKSLIMEDRDVIGPEIDPFAPSVSKATAKAAVAKKRGRPRKNTTAADDNDATAEPESTPAAEEPVTGKRSASGKESSNEADEEPAETTASSSNHTPQMKKRKTAAQPEGTTVMQPEPSAAASTEPLSQPDSQMHESPTVTESSEPSGSRKRPMDDENTPDDTSKKHRQEEQVPKSPAKSAPTSPAKRISRRQAGIKAFFPPASQSANAQSKERQQAAASPAPAPPQSTAAPQYITSKPPQQPIFVVLQQQPGMPGASIPRQGIPVVLSPRPGMPIAPMPPQGIPVVLSPQQPIPAVSSSSARESTPSTRESTSQPERPLTPVKRERSRKPKTDVRSSFVDLYPQPNAPKQIADLQVVPFPDHWKELVVSERNATQSHFKRRQETIMQVVAKHGAVVFDQKFLFEVTEAVKEATNSKSGAIDRKSVKRALVMLGHTGEIKMYPLEFKRLSGAVTTVMLMLMPHVPPESGMVVNYIARQKEEMFVVTSRSQPKDLAKRVDQRVERVEERIKRLEEAVETGQGDEEMSKELKALKAAKKAVHKRLALKPVETHRIVKTAFRNGYIIAKMLRAKIFMICLRQLANLQHTNTVTTKDIVRRMTLRAFAQTLGVYVSSEETKKVLSDKEKLDTPLRDLDAASRRVIWSHRQNLFHKLKTNLEILHSLGLIKPDVGNKVAHGMQMSPTFTLISHVKLRDFTRPGLPFLEEELPVGTVKEIEDYWEKLQTSCLRVEVFPDEDDENASKRVEEIKQEQIRLAKEVGYIAGISLRSSWENKFLYSDKQVEILESYIDTEHNRTPLNDPIVCEEIASKAGLEYHRVKQYYMQVNNYRHKKLKRLKQEQNPMIRHLVSKQNMTVIMVPNRPPEPLYQKRGRKGTVFRRRQRNERHNPQDDEDALPVVDVRDGTKELVVAAPAIRNRQPWSPEDDEILLYAYAIMKSRRFISWKPMVQIFPQRSPNSCRNRIHILTRTSTQQARLFRLVKAWETAYREGLKSGELREHQFEVVQEEGGENEEEGKVLMGLKNRPVRYTIDDNYDLKEGLRYFLEVMQRQGDFLDMVDTFTIPATVAEINANYDVKDTASIDRVRWLIDSWDESRNRSFLLRSKILYAGSLTLQTGAETGQLELADTSVSEDERRINDIRVILKMILLTPGDNFDPRTAYQTLYRYPIDLVMAATKISIQNNVLTKARYSGNTKTTLPPRTFSMTDRFLAQLSGTWPPRLIAQALAYRFHLQSKDIVPFSETCSSGMIFCLLDMFAHKSTRFYVHNEDAYKDAAMQPWYNNRSIDSLKIDFRVDVDVRDNAISPTVEPIEPLQYEEQKEQQWEVACNAFRTANMAVCTRIIDLVRRAEGNGISILDIKEKMRDIMHTDQDILQTLRDMRNATPPIVYFVGAGDGVVISPCHLRSWLPRLKKTELNADGRLVPAHMWRDFEGGIMQHVLAGCLQVVLEQIQRNPGITSKTILHKLKNLLVAGEVTEVLKILEDRRCIKSRPITYPTPATLFSGPRAFQCIDKDAIVKEKFFCYWALPDCWINIA